VSTYDFDLFVIGAGSGGVRAARMAAAEGVKVAITEDRYMGGTCVNVGCVPKKLFTYASHYAEDFEDAEGFGWQVGERTFDWPTLRDRKNAEIERLNGIYRNLLTNSGCQLIEGRGRVIDAHTVEVGGKHYSTERILIATGGWPFIPDFPGKEHAISSNEVFYLENFPKRALVVGGGYIAVEFAGIFAGLGVETTMINRSEGILKGFDEDIRSFVSDEMKKKGINLLDCVTVSAIDPLEDQSYTVTLTDGTTLNVDCVLVATGRVPNTRNLGLENVKVECADNGAIKVNDSFQTSEPSIYAIGDVIDRVQLTPVALAEGMALVRHLYKGGDASLDYSGIPTAVFCQPNIGTVGLSEQQAVEKGYDVEIYRSNFKAMKHTLSGRDERTLMKLVVDKSSDKVLGVHMAGADSGEIIQGFAVALKAGATKAVFDSTIGIHPTAAEEFVTMREPVKN
jgi:glutathione reductase (NADPH)